MKKLLLTLFLCSSLNGYSQWNILSTGYTDVLLMDITKTQSGKLIAVGTKFGLNFMPHIFTSNDQGITWDTTQVTPSGFFFHTIGFLDGALGYIGGYGSISTIVQTTDSGNTWAYYYVDVANSGILDIEVSDSAHAIACGYGPTQFSSGSVYTLANQATWAPIAQTFLSSSLEDVQMLNPDTGYALSYSDRELYVTTNGGSNWTLISTLPTHVGKMFWWDMSSGITVGANAHYYITTDGGNSWASDSIPGYTEELTGVVFTDNYNGYACSIDGHLFHSSNGGLSWTVEPTITTNDLYCLEIHGGEIFAVGENGTILSHQVPTNISSPKDQVTFNIFPNPAHQAVNIEWQGLTSGKILSFELLGINGQLTSASYVQKNNQLRVDVSQLEKGIYILRIATDKGIYTGKVTVM